MTEKIGIVGFSFGLRAASEEPNPSNEMLANAILGAHTAIGPEGKPIVVVTQWEITKAIRNNHYGFVVNHSVELRPDGTYLDSNGVWEEAKAVFARGGGLFSYLKKRIIRRVNSIKEAPLWTL